MALLREVILKKRRQYAVITAVIVFTAIAAAEGVYAQNIQRSPERIYRIVDGVMKEVVHDTTTMMTAVDPGDSLSVFPDETPYSGIILKSVDTNPMGSDSDTVLTKAEQRALRRLERNDPAHVRYSRIFRDTIPLSRMTAISLVIPGYSQLYNKQAWKIPVLYVTAGATAYLGVRQNRKYLDYRHTYDAMIKRNAPREELDPVQTQMIKHNTNRMLLFAGALATYAYFLGDGVINYQGRNATDVKKATTLSTIFPGAGQIYNHSLWKVPIIYGALATMAYIVDYNTRGYKRTKLAYDIATDDDPNNTHELLEYPYNYSADQLRSLKNNYRRNRDMSIILTAGVYLLNIIDAHVDAHMKSYDVSDDFTVSLEPSITHLYTIRSQNTTALGLSLKLHF